MEGVFAGRGDDRTVDREAHGVGVGHAGQVVRYFAGGRTDEWVSVGRGAGVDHLVGVVESKVGHYFGVEFSDHLEAVDLSRTDRRFDVDQVAS